MARQSKTDKSSPEPAGLKQPGGNRKAKWVKWEKGDGSVGMACESKTDKSLPESAGLKQPGGNMKANG
jgi:hypothetical protein